jgi:methenyltetrahydromethanopterin cyclohydrolase
LSIISVNKRAAAIVEQMVHDREALGLGMTLLDNGTAVLDAGIHVPGSFEAGRLFSCACLGGLGQVSFTQQTFCIPESKESFWLPAVAVSVQNPPIACMGSQYAGWAVRLDRYFAIGSGPARALYGDEEIYRKLAYQDQSKTAILMLEGRELPDERVADSLAEKCRVNTDQLALLIAPTASLVGSIQIAARSAETGMHKMAELGFDINQVTAALGLCPIAPVAADDLRAIGRTNDAILYGSQVFYTVRAEDEELSALIEKVPASSSRDYGTPFYDLFKRCNWDFYQIDRMLFSPACVEINNLNSGRTFRAGRLNASLLHASLLDS